jgi:hypothetical protein
MFYKTLSLAILSSIAVAAVSEIELVADSSETSVNGLGLSSIHEGAGINYFLLGSGSETLKFDEETGTVYANLTDTITQYVSINSANILQLSVLAPQKVTVADGVVSVDGNESFFACKNINDPYRYTEKSFAILSKNGDGCFPMKIKIKDGQTPSASETPSKPSDIPHISSIPENGANLKSAGSIVGAAAIIAALL